MRQASLASLPRPACTVALMLATACEPTTPTDTGKGTEPTDSAADSAPDTGADTGGGTDTGVDTDTGGDTSIDTGPPPEACEPTSEAAVTLCADRFWSQSYDATTQAELNAAIATMPAELKVQSLADASQRAEQLQWAFVAMNALTASSVAVLVPATTYDFSALHDAHPSVPSSDVYQLPLLPKLFVIRDNVIVRGVLADEAPVLTASGPGADGVNHGRVFLLIDSSATDILVENLTFTGDASSEHFTDPAYFLHEQDAALYFTAQWGAAMVGLNGGANHATFVDCRFDQLNGTAISAVGLLTVQNSVFEGVLPFPEDANPEEAAVALFDAISAERGASPGMDFHSGIRRAYAYGPTVVENSVFRNLVQGIVMAPDGFALTVNQSSFSDIYDHAIYVLGNATGSEITENSFDGVSNGAVKFAGNSTDVDPELANAGLQDGVVSDNTFERMRNGAMNVSGVRNEIARNEVVAYDPATDPTGYYDPFQRPDYHYPDAFLITEAGQAGWANHIWGNTFTDNTTTSGNFDIFIQQRPNVADRSISENVVSGAGQSLYFRHMVPCSENAPPCSSYTPTVTAEAGATLIFGAPPDCADCYPNDSGYISELP